MSLEIKFKGYSEILQLDAGRVYEAIQNAKLTRLQFAALHVVPRWYRDLEKMAYDLAMKLCFENGIISGIEVGPVTCQAAYAAIESLQRRRYIDRISKQLSERIIEGRSSLTAVDDVTIEDLQSLYIQTRIGYATWVNIVRSSVCCIEKGERDEVIHGVGRTITHDECLRVANLPRTSNCSNGNCITAGVGPWMIPGKLVYPTGWRIICRA